MVLAKRQAGRIAMRAQLDHLTRAAVGLDPLHQRTDAVRGFVRRGRLRRQDFGGWLHLGFCLCFWLGITGGRSYDGRQAAPLCAQPGQERADGRG